MTRFGMKARALALLLVISTRHCEGQLLSRWNLRHVTSRLLQEGDRHPNSVMENEQDKVENHPNPVMLRNSYFTEKYCSPDVNGYYGSTMGTPYEIAFGFEAETAPGADLDQVKNAIHDSIETALLTTFFPTMCQKEGTTYDSEVTGFHFDPTATQFTKPCRVLVNDENTCGVYVGTIRVYGEEGDALTIIRDHLDRDGNGENIHQHLRRLFSVDTSNSDLIGVSSGEDDKSGGMSSGGVAGLVIALVALSVGIVGMAVVHVRRRRNSNVQELSSEEGSRSMSDIDEGESVETVDLQAGSAVVIAGGRPKTIIVDPEAVQRYQADML